MGAASGSVEEGSRVAKVSVVGAAPSQEPFGHLEPLNSTTLPEARAARHSRQV